MINQEVITSVREILGQRFKEIMAEKGMTAYAVSKATGMTLTQIKSILSGDRAYTLDSFLRMCYALDQYFYLADKEGKHLDQADMIEKGIKGHPGKAS